MTSAGRVRLSWMLVAIVASTALAFGAIDDAGPETNADRVFELARTIRCPQCVGQSVAESDVAISREIRADIARRVDAGETDAEIRQAFVDRYDQSILLTPEGSGLASLVWVIPVAGLICAAAALAYAFWRWRDPEPLRASDEDRALVDRARAPGAGDA